MNENTEEKPDATAKTKCPDCDGWGAIHWTKHEEPTRICKKCNGLGQIERAAAQKSNPSATANDATAKEYVTDCKPTGTTFTSVEELKKHYATASDTPRTDAAERLYADRQHHYAVRDLARQLERELSEAQFHRKLADLTGEKCVAELSTLRREKAELREALKTLKHYTSSGYDVFEPPMGSPRKPTKTTTGKFIDAILAATKEKEGGK